MGAWANPSRSDSGYPAIKPDNLILRIENDQWQRAIKGMLINVRTLYRNHSIMPIWILSVLHSRREKADKKQSPVGCLGFNLLACLRWPSGPHAVHRGGSLQARQRAGVQWAPRLHRHRRPNSPEGPPKSKSRRRPKTQGGPKPGNPTIATTRQQRNDSSSCPSRVADLFYESLIFVAFFVH